MKTSLAALIVGLIAMSFRAPAMELSTPLSEEIVPLRDARLLDLGARLGRDRLKVIAWAERGEIIRLRFPFVEESEPSIGTYFGMPILSRVQMTPKVLLGFQNALLDHTTYEHLDLSKPIPGRGAGKLCGGFRPTIGLRFMLTDGRSLDILVSYTCYDLQFRRVNEDPLHTETPPLQGATDQNSLSGRGGARLLELSISAFPSDQRLKQRLKQWKGAADLDAVQHGVAPDGRSPAAPARR